MPVFFARELETVATYWRIFRKDGVAFGFTSHDRDLYFGGLLHRASPGMVPSAIRLTSDHSPDSAEVEGALTHDAITAGELAAGLFDQAQVEIGAVDWETLEVQSIYAGELGRITDDRGGFSAELRSAKSVLEREFVPRTSPTCRAQFCGPGCGLSAARFTHRSRTASIDPDSNRVTVSGLAPQQFHDGLLRFCEGPQTGLVFSIIEATDDGLMLDRPLTPGLPQEMQIELREGCDHTIATCRTRFGNAVNFRGEPFLPGNDLLARYPRPQ